MNPIGWLSRLLVKCGLPDYIRRVEFAAHVGWGLVFGFAGYYWHWGLWVFWAALVLWDEFYCDGHWRVIIGNKINWRDLLCDLASKYVGEIGFIAAKLI